MLFVYLLGMCVRSDEVESYVFIIVWPLFPMALLIQPPALVFTCSLLVRLDNYCIETYPSSVSASHIHSIGAPPPPQPWPPPAPTLLFRYFLWRLRDLSNSLQFAPCLPIYKSLIAKDWICSGCTFAAMFLLKLDSIIIQYSAFVQIQTDPLSMHLICPKICFWIIGHEFGPRRTRWNNWMRIRSVRWKTEPINLTTHRMDPGICHFTISSSLFFLFQEELWLPLFEVRFIIIVISLVLFLLIPIFLNVYLVECKRSWW